MFTITVTPRFGDLDALGHINNTVPVLWFEVARNPIIKLFDPSLELTRKTFPLVMAHSEYDYVNQLHFRCDVEIRTWITRIGTKSFTVYHEAWQEGRLCVKGSVAVVHYDFSTEQSTPVPEERKKQLSEHFIDSKETLNESP